MIDQEQRRQRFAEAAELLGGGHATARILSISERQMRYLLSGKHAIKQGFMRDITAALEHRARECQRVARTTDPLFSANWTAAEQADRGRANAEKARQEARRG